ncbi:MAG: N-acetyltransferase [Planctomycetes bacterium]|nr:N-acetyltransferase [Planctomycetota bacterium]
MSIRGEAPAEVEAVRRVNDAAFGRPDEGRLVDALRGAARPFVSLVARDDDEVVGHVLFTPVTVGATWTALALGPMAVVPGRQRAGFGAALVRAGLDACRALGHDVVFVLGHPAYYPRFGFAPAAPRGLRCKWPVPDDVFLVAELAPGALAGRTGLVEYHPAFDAAT